MPALSFQEEWIDRLLAGTKQQITLPQTSRIKVGDVCNIYNQQRKKIIDKLLRSLTDEGYGKMAQLSHRSQGSQYPAVPFTNPARQYPAHFLGRVQITDVDDILPIEMSEDDLDWWVGLDGFEDSANLGFTDLELADTWFRAHYGDDWMQQQWTVIQWWNGWLERYFEPEE